MIALSFDPNATLGSFLHARALNSTASRLGLDFLGGSLLISFAVGVKPIAWPVLVCVGFCFASYAIWAVTEQAIDALSDESARPIRIGWAISHAVATAVGLISLMALLFSIVAASLGTWIS